MIKMSQMETFAISDHRPSTYTDLLDARTDLPGVVTLHSNRSRVGKRWLVMVGGLSILIFMIFYSKYKSEEADTEKPKPSQPPVHKTTKTIESHSNEYYIPHSLSVDDRPDLIFNHAQTYFDSSMDYLVEPLHYELTFEPVLPNSNNKNTRRQFTFKGKAAILLRVRQELDSLALGAMDLSVEKMALKKLKRNYRPFNSTSVKEVTQWIKVSFDAYDSVNGTIYLELDDPMFPLQAYELEIEYSGRIQELPFGFFRLFYADVDNGDEKWVVGSNTEIPFARAMFPCFDTPDLKTTFSISVGHYANTAVISNIQQAQKHPRKDGLVWHEYESKKRMPLSSLSLALTNFQNETKFTHDLKFNVWTSVDHPENTKYVLDLAPKLIQCMETYFKLPLMVKEINIFGLPQRISHQRAEIGIIYVSESDIAVNKNETSEYQKEQTALHLASSLIEQFIDAYVVFECDSDNWIKDSLVQYLSYQFVHYVEPSWNVLKQFQVDVQQVEMNDEVESSIRQSTPLRGQPHRKGSEKHYMFPVNETSVFQHYSKHTSASIIAARHSEGAHVNPEIFTQLHERRSREKATCLFRMIQQMVSDSVFKQALRKFLNRKSDSKLVEGTDLWDALTEEARNSSITKYGSLPEHSSVQSIVEDWLFSNGYPLVTVIRDYKNNTILFRQTTETSEDSPAQKSPLVLWHIPISFTTENELFFSASSPRHWMNKAREMRATAPAKLTSDKWILVNPAQNAFYRVNYDTKNWKLLKSAFEKGTFPDTVRAQLLDDALSLGRIGLLDHEFSLDMMNLLTTHEEEQYVVWRPVFRHLGYIQEVLKETNGTKASSGTSQRFKKYVLKLISPTFEHLQHLQSTNPGCCSHQDKLLYSEMILWACALGHSGCRDEARKKFDEWKACSKPDEQNPIEANIRYAVLCSIMADGEKADYHFLLKRYKKSHSNAPHKYEYLKSLFCYQDSEILNFLISNTLERALTVDHLNEVQDMWTAALETFYEFEDIFTTVVDYWERISAKFASFRPIMEAILKAATKNITTRNELTKIKDFQKNNSQDITDSKVLEDAEKSLKRKLDWKEKRLHEFDAWVKKTLFTDFFKKSNFTSNHEESR